MKCGAEDEDLSPAIHSGSDSLWWEAGGPPAPELVASPARIRWGLDLDSDSCHPLHGTRGLWAVLTLLLQGQLIARNLKPLARYAGRAVVALSASRSSQCQILLKYFAVPV